MSRSCSVQENYPVGQTSQKTTKQTAEGNTALFTVVFIQPFRFSLNRLDDSFGFDDVDSPTPLILKEYSCTLTVTCWIYIPSDQFGLFDVPLSYCSFITLLLCYEPVIIPARSINPVRMGSDQNNSSQADPCRYTGFPWTRSDGLKTLYRCDAEDGLRPVLGPPRTSKGEKYVHTNLSIQISSYLWCHTSAIPPCFQTASRRTTETSPRTLFLMEDFKRDNSAKIVYLLVFRFWVQFVQRW